MAESQTPGEFRQAKKIINTQLVNRPFDDEERRGYVIINEALTALHAPQAGIRERKRRGDDE